MQKSIRVFARASRGMATQAQASAVSIQQMKNSKHDFVHFINSAALDDKSPERKELYQYLTGCFVDNDTDYDGLVSYRGFNSMIAEAAQAPRRFGFAPHTREIFKSKEEYDLQRVAMFNELAKGGSRISLDSWLNWAMPHIKEKVGAGLAEHKEARWERSKEDLISFVKGIAKEKSLNNPKSSTSTQYKELYLMNHAMFMECDAKMNGLLDEAAFNKLMIKANAVPQKFGLDFYSKIKMTDVTKNKTCSFQECQAYLFKVITAQAGKL